MARRATSNAATPLSTKPEYYWKGANRGAPIPVDSNVYQSKAEVPLKSAGKMGSSFAYLLEPPPHAQKLRAESPKGVKR